MELKERIFAIRAKDELGQYLDDEQQWREGLPFTRLMEQRLEVIIEEARREVVEKVGREDEVLIARKVVEYILRRRGGDDYKQFAELNRIEIPKKANLYVKTEESRLKDMEQW